MALESEVTALLTNNAKLLFHHILDIQVTRL